MQKTYYQSSGEPLSAKRWFYEGPNYRLQISLKRKGSPSVKGFWVRFITPESAISPGGAIVKSPLPQPPRGARTQGEFTESLAEAYGEIPDAVE